MSVNPGSADRSSSLGFAEDLRIRKMCADKGLNPRIEVDGGVTNETAPSVVKAGADVLVAEATSSAFPITRLAWTR
jgi:ribulose-phosphate 3-epimerase